MNEVQQRMKHSRGASSRERNIVVNEVLQRKNILHRLKQPEAGSTRG